MAVVLKLMSVQRKYRKLFYKWITVVLKHDQGCQYNF